MHPIYFFKEETVVVTISSFSNITAGQLVNVKGKVLHLSAAKKLVMSTGTLMKQDCYIADPSGHKGVVFWEDYIDNVHKAKTDQFTRFRTKKTG